MRNPRKSDPPINVILLPGVSWMNLEYPSHDVSIVTCPGCGASQTYTSESPPRIRFVGFVHQSDDCPIHQRIQTVWGPIERVLKQIKTPFVADQESNRDSQFCTRSATPPVYKP
jgi:hypothetical protein